MKNIKPHKQVNVGIYCVIYQNHLAYALLYIFLAAGNMGQKASDIHKQRIKEIEIKADELVKKCNVMFVSSVNEKGYLRTCCVNKLSDGGFREIYFVN